MNPANPFQITVPTESRDTAKLVQKVQVGGEFPYPVWIGSGAITRLVSCLPETTRSVLIVHPDSLESYAQKVAQILQENGLNTHFFVHPDAEAAKTASVLEHGWHACSAAHLTRQDAIVSLGGGASTDLGGFIAATWLRGIHNVNLPTTLLGMVDAAIGGKTGINVPEGKNLVGAFYPPRAVICELDFLDTLPADELIAGMGEVVKCGYIQDPQILSLLDAILPPSSGEWSIGARGVRAPSGVEKDQYYEKIAAVLRPHLGELVTRCVQVKARVVSEDLREGGLREILNYGHTLGHAVERAHQYKLRHGQCVALGCVYAAQLACLLEIAPPVWAKAHREMLSRVGLATTYTEQNFSELYDAMTNDKKVRQGVVRFVLVPQPGSAFTQPIEDYRLLEQAFSELATV